MSQPWGISGTQFLVLYGIALVVAFGYALLLRWRLRRPQGPLPPLQVNVDELAFLVAGPGRAAEAAIARLVESGRVHVSRQGLLTAGVLTSSDPVEAAVLRVIEHTPRRGSYVIRKVTGSGAVSAISDRLVEHRLLVEPSAIRRRALLWLYLLMAVGVLRLVNGVRLGHPVGYLALLLLLTAALTIMLYRRGSRTRTRHGDKLCASVRASGANESNPWLRPSVALAGAGGSVALGGLAAFPDPTVRDALTAGTTTTGGGGGDGGCGSSDSGGGCGGGCGGGGE